ncbi:MAG: S1 RNA-binding domain-containing protein [Candidatus Marsarchaeota archaeon]|jgi:translation initiation factor 2 subunit 1|nr:S1 RNA-binding domain-containing protein [Candidatus Marsarchaeota archaeon]
MILPKKMPDVGELVLVRINKIMPYGAYCTLQEYNADAYLPISEIASGWIKNIHEFIKEGQKEVAKVIFIDNDKRAIDISFKKASAGEKKGKMADYNLEKRAEGIFNKALAASGTESRKAEIISEIGRREQTYNDLINDIFENKDPLSGFKEADFKQALYDLVFKLIKPKKYTVSYTIEMTTTNTRAGISLIKEALAAVAGTGVSVLYLGAPHYKIISEGPSYPKAESKIKEAQAALEKYSKQISFSIKSNKGEASG